MAIASIACHNTEYFQNLTTVYTTTSESLPISYLRNPTRFSKYLRLAIGTWIVRNEVNINNIVPQYWHHNQNSLCFQHANSLFQHLYANNDDSSNGKSDVEVSSVADNELQNRNDTINQPGSCLPKDIVGGKCKDGQNNEHETQEECTEVISEPLNGNGKRDSTIPNNKEQHRCTACGLSFARKFTLKRHVAKKHPDLIDSYSEGNCVCQSCGFKCHMIKTLQEHLAKEHSVALHEETIVLESRTGKFSNNNNIS